MKHLRLLVFPLAAIFLAGTAAGQSLPAVVKSATVGGPRAKRVITNDDIPSVVAESSKAGDARKSLAATTSAIASDDDEVCKYIGELRGEEQQLQHRVQKLQASLDKADSDLLRSVYSNALVRLTESLHRKQVAREEAEGTPQGGSCSRKAVQAEPKTAGNQ